LIREVILSEPFMAKANLVNQAKEK
jgi:hypothetical protein